MRTLLRAALASVLVLSSVVGPVSAATTGATTIAQATQSTITGKVTDDRGNALVGTRVEASGPAHASTTTGNDGTFTLSVPAGIYVITANKGGFTAGENDGVVVVGGVPLRVGITLSESSLQSTRVIGRTTSSGNGNNRAPFNISESATSTLLSSTITTRQNTNLTDLVAEIPGVTVARGFSVTPNTSFAVRGLPYQTRTTIDGHAVSSGIAGQWNSNYALSTMFQSVEVTKGAGLNGALAGESAVGTVNLRTRDFTVNNSAGLTFTTDTYNGSGYDAYADINLLKDNRLSLIVQEGYQGYNGPWNGFYGDRVNTGNISAIPIGTNSIPQFIGLDQWQGDFSNRYALQGQLLKARYKFSESTSLTAEYLGLQGQYAPQGGSYGSYYGKMTLQACQTGSTFSSSLAGCGPTSVFTAPYTFGQLGSQVDAYTWFPNSYIQNNEPQFSAELRTTFKGDTILFRPFTHVINRYISGVAENTYPGNASSGGGWYQVTSNANCQVQFLKPGTTGGPAVGAAGPCFGSNMSPTSAAYIGSATQTPVFATTSALPNNGAGCSVASPCYTTTTGIQNDGRYGYATPFSQPEVDRLFGYTFTYLHPMGDNSLNFTYDYRLDATSSASSDQSGAAAGCRFVIGTATGASVNQANGTPFQPGCTTAMSSGAYASYNLLPRSSIGTPITVASYSDFSLTGLFQLSAKLKLAVGNYFEIYKVQPQSENPATLTQYAALGNAGAAPVNLVTTPTTFSHYDPHIGLEYRVDPSISLRANFGSSITQPYASILSGFGNITIPNAANNQSYTVAIPNASLKPETTVTYNLGADKRLGDGTVLSFDAYHINTHNVFISQSQTIVPPAAYAGASSAVQTNYVNGPEQISYGVEVSALHNPTLGFGYYATASLNRSYYLNIPLSFYAFNTSATNPNYNINGEQLFGNPFSKGYASVFYNGVRGFTASLGAEYNGQDNPTYSNPYVLWDAAVRIPIVSNKFSLQLAVQNLTNYNNNTNLARGLVNQGNIEPAVYLSNGSLVYAGPNSRTQTSVFSVPPRDFRLSGILHL